MLRTPITPLARWCRNCSTSGPNTLKMSSPTGADMCAGDSSGHPRFWATRSCWRPSAAAGQGSLIVSVPSVVALPPALLATISTV
jgi:hypothetical protein